jgi:hypothetical protein
VVHARKAKKATTSASQPRVLDFMPGIYAKFRA